MVLERLVSINEDNRNLLTIGFLEVGIRFNIDDAKCKRETEPDAVDNLLRFIAEMAARARIDFDVDGIIRH